MSQTTQTKRCAILVMSCDAYADLWVPFFNLFEKYWSDCPFPLYLGAENQTLPNTNVVTLQSSSGSRNWTGRLADYLGHLQREYDHVLLLLDDFFFRKKVATDLVLHCLRFSQQNNATMVRLIPRPKPTHSIINESIIGQSEVGSPYRVCTQAAFWHIESLKKLLLPNESIWNFEHNANVRALAFIDGYFSVWRAVLPYQGLLTHHVVEKGAWFPHEKHFYAGQGIGCDFTKRGVLSKRYVFFYLSAQFLDWSLGSLPWRKKRGCKDNLKKMLRLFINSDLEKMSGKSMTAPRKG